jgi:hypothetical protein
MSKKEKLAFYEGVMWAACWLVQAHDEPTIAAEMCREAGVDEIRLKKREPFDRPAARKILENWD